MTETEPDASFISTERLATLPKTPDGKFYRFVPDLIVEILSRSTAKRDRTVGSPGTELEFAL